MGPGSPQHFADLLGLHHVHGDVREDAPDTCHGDDVEDGAGTGREEHPLVVHFWPPNKIAPVFSEKMRVRKRRGKMNPIPISIPIPNNIPPPVIY